MKRLMAILAGALVTSGPALAADMLTPGLYEVKTEILETNMPMAPRGQTVKQCITQADIEQDPETLFHQQPESQNCDVAEFDIGGGQVSMRLACAMGGGDMTMTMQGTYTATGYDMTNDMQVNAGGMAMSMRSRSTAQRVGDCN